MKNSQTSNGFDIIRDPLETDVYDASMINAILQLYPGVIAEYDIVDRDRAFYPKGFAGLLTEKIQDLKYLKSDPKLRSYLQKTAPHLSPIFFDWLVQYRFNPDYVKLWQNADGQLFGRILGPLEDIIPFEQASMAIASQIRNEIFDWFPDDNWVDVLYQIIELAISYYLIVSEFGLRRRAHTFMHDTIASVLDQRGGSMYVGSSSPFHNFHYGGRASKGTVAHLWYLLHGAKYGIENANEIASIAWRAVYGDDLGTGLPDTWGRRLYFSTIAPGMAQRIKSYRHDSGDAFEFTDDLKAFFSHPKNRCDLKKITLMFTDSLDIQKAIKINQYATQWFQVAFGIGGHFTNNSQYFKKTPAYRPLNMVAKPVSFSFDGGNTFVKIAKVPDGKGKNVGDPAIIAEIERIKASYPWIY